MDVRVVLNYKGVTTLITDCVKCLTFTNHIDFITWPGQYPVVVVAVFYEVVVGMIWKKQRAVPEYA